MTKLAWLGLFAVSVFGCTRSALIIPDGGTGVCAQYGSAGSCGGDARCDWYSCCGHDACVAKGEPVPECTPDCNQCTGLVESECKATAGCRADYCSNCGCSPAYVACNLQGSTAPACPGVCTASCQCDGLDEQTCIADQSLGCTANYCSTCGSSTFSGCTGPGEGAPACPLKCPVNLSCHSSSDCTRLGGGTCDVPGGTTCNGGVCLPGCASDGECAAGQVCDYTCSCGTTQKACIAGCSPSSCGDGQVCASDGHCAALICASGVQCPAYFDCVFPSGPGSPTCQRRACSGDSDCGSGSFCVDGGCYATLGTCVGPQP